MNRHTVLLNCCDSHFGFLLEGRNNDKPRGHHLWHRAHRWDLPWWQVSFLRYPTHRNWWLDQRTVHAPVIPPVTCLLLFLTYSNHIREYSGCYMPANTFVFVLSCQPTRVVLSVCFCLHMSTVKEKPTLSPKQLLAPPLFSLIVASLGALTPAGTPWIILPLPEFFLLNKPISLTMGWLQQPGTTVALAPLNT